jgi:hypothetical protein
MSRARTSGLRAGSRASRLPGPVELRRFVRQLRSPSRASAVRGAVDGVVVAWALRRRGARRLVPPGIDAPPGTEVRHDGTTPDGERGRVVAAAVDAGLGLVPMAKTCLRRSLTLSRELHRLGVAGTVHVGARRRAGVIEAHAWVQVGDVVVNDDPAEVATYAELAAGELEQVLPSLR